MMPRVPAPGGAIGSTFDCRIFRHLQPWLLRAGFSDQLIKERFVEFGQGVASSHTVITMDDAGNRRPSKRKSTAKIDGLVALTMAIGVAPLQAKQIDIEALIA
jgi:hypothetical protein